MSFVCLSVIAGILLCFLSANYPDRYLNLDKPGGMYFCASRYGCGDTFGTWNLKEWDCFARMEFYLEMTNASVQCSKYPYGNWVQVDSCRLSYEVTPVTKHLWFETTCVVDFWGVTSSCFGALTFLVMLLALSR